MKTLAVLATVFATPALAHSGAHVHPHDGASWIVMAASLALLLGAGALGLATRKVRA